MAAASHARAPAFRVANVVPRMVIFAAAATVVGGMLIRHLPRRAGDRDAALRHGVGPASAPARGGLDGRGRDRHRPRAAPGRRGRSPGVVRRPRAGVRPGARPCAQRRARGHPRVGRDLRPAARRLVRGGQRVSARVAGALLRHAFLPRPLRRARPVAAGQRRRSPAGAAARAAWPRPHDRRRRRRAVHRRRRAVRPADLRPRSSGGQRARRPRGSGALRLLAGGAALRRDVVRRRLRHLRPGRRRAARGRAGRPASGRRGGARSRPPCSRGRSSRSAHGPPASPGAGAARRQR